MRETVATMNHIKGETISKYWSGVNRATKPRDTMFMLQDPQSENNYTRDTFRMVEIAKNHHESLQRDGLENDEEETQNRETREVLQNCNARVPEEVQEKLSERLSSEEVQTAIESLPNSKSPGMDGLPVEVWKALCQRCDERNENSDPDEENFDIREFLADTFNDLDENGPQEDSLFSEGWMCPLYKKKDRTDISNYRPITVLNSDYKIYTKALTFRLAEAAPHIIHPDQAGFMKGRRIENHTDLMHSMIEWSEMSEQNGTIVLLDQEKAYDRIRHDYLWDCLEHFGIPERFRRTVQHLYKKAETKIMINGIFSDTFEVKRGVRQGDPLSCLLFNIAIEPLAEAIRRSELTGFNVPGLHENILVSLFADDTTVYLANTDSYDELQRILNLWCKASGARFNIEKTEIVPIGTREHRNRITETRQISPNDRPLPNGIRIVGERMTARALGAHIGNNAEQETIWTSVLEKVDTALDRWSRSSPTEEGRRLIALMIIAGMTQYLTRVQGMPKEVEKRLERRITKFIWNEKRPPINIETLRLQINEGGLDLLDIKTRNEAIEIMRVQTFLSLGPKRPKWTYVEDAIIRSFVAAPYLDILAQGPLYLLQDIPLPAPSRLPTQTRRLVKTMKACNARAEPPMPSAAVQLAMPAWRHPGGGNYSRHHTRTQRATCLRRNHGVETIRDLMIVAARLTDWRHKKRRNCACAICKQDRERTNCTNPNRCARQAWDLLGDIGPKWDPRRRLLEYEEPLAIQQEGHLRITERDNNAAPFNADVTTGDDLGDTFRIFLPRENSTNLAPSPDIMTPRRDDPIKHITLTAITTFKSDHNNYYGVASPDDNTSRPILIKIPEAWPKNNLTLELTAIAHTLHHTDPGTDIVFTTSNAQVRDVLSTRMRIREAIAWVNTPAPRELLMSIVAKMQARTGASAIRYAKTKADFLEIKHLRNRERDNLRRGRMQPIPLRLPETPSRYTTKGAKLQALSQADIYRIIKNEKALRVNQRRQTQINLAIVQHAVGDLNQRFPEPAEVWRGIRDREIPKNIRSFIWKAIHGALKIGEYWERIPNYEQRGQCNTCGGREDLEHILDDCPNTGQGVVNRLAYELLRRKGVTLPRRRSAVMLGSPLIRIRNNKGKTRRGATRLTKIVLTESLYLIWRLRNEWRLRRDADPERRHTKLEITRRWTATINKRLTWTAG
ncbi:hypothetical protein NP233_g5392 [Leucocoprinus birnbaumii]|uniref:Reverse transcriptase domain-containing protein n=1 Tax=Leucocoprinus birnbaumii TaxID=56174 RepID=A0AAD5VU69_9AGAR|nr:hypothetical protein NP233_g5392 [Leucocoprinus birnbaumii]